MDKEVIESIKKNVKKGQKVLIQLPAGLRKYALEISKLVEEQGAIPLIWAGTCYGACDIPNYKCDVILHFGHKEMTK